MGSVSLLLLEKLALPNFLVAKAVMTKHTLVATLEVHRYRSLAFGKRVVYLKAVFIDLMRKLIIKFSTAS